MGDRPRYRRLAKAFRRLRDSGETVFPRLADVGLRVARRAGEEHGVYCQGRARAYCSYTDPVEVTVAPCLEQEEDARIEGILRHELAHAIDALYSRKQIAARLGVAARDLPSPDEEAERLADVIAEILWGKPILYDEDEIQSIEFGVTPRPRHLPR